MPGAGAGIVKKALISYRGKSSALGTNSLIICAALAALPDYNGQAVLILDGPCKGQIRGINGITIGGQVNTDSAFDAVITSGISFLILAQKLTTAELATLIAASNANLVLTETGGTVTTTGPATEDIVYINDDPQGEYKPEKVFIDFTNQTAAETTVVREYYRLKEGGDYIKEDNEILAGVQDPALIGVELEPCRFGIKVTIERTAGVAKTYDWEVHFAD